MKRVGSIAVVLVCVLVPGLSQESPKPVEKPRLVVVVSIDQMKEEYFEWYGKLFTGGFKRLESEGVFYANAMLDYASSETGPGHATLSTGSFPRVHGILGNEWIDPASRKQVYCVSDTTAGAVSGEGGGVSPKNLVVSALGDWVKAASPRSRVISISVKDRAAILMGGKHPDQAYWYDRSSGHFVTSSYYGNSVASWMKSFNAGNWVFRNVPPVWSPLLPDSMYSGPDELAGETPWNGTTTMPKVFNLAKRADELLTSPWGDLMVLDAARAAIDGEQLGKRAVPDVLMLSLSCTDYVGHAYGGNSREMQDHLVRLDLALGQFIADLETRVGPGKFVLALSADHACLPLPEYTAQVEHRFARRLNVRTEIAPRVSELDSLLRIAAGTTEQLVSMDGFLNYSAIRRSKLSVTEFERRVRKGLLAIDGVSDVYFKRELSDTGGPARPYLQRFRNSYYAPRGEDLQVRFCEGCLLTSRGTGTSHGTCYDYDNHVPVIVYGVHSPVNRVTRPVRTVDVAPTLARILGVNPPSTISGTALSEVIDR